jgi:MarR family transcriptional regulator for hemolysin
MATPLKRIRELARARTTYHIGLIQTKAYRLLKQRTAKALAPEKITPAEWAFLGVLYDAPGSIRLNKVADALGVEAPFVTAMMRKLQKNQYLQLEADPDDSRAKAICLTDEGRAFVQRTEKTLRETMKPLIKGISMQDLLTFLSVTQRLIENAEKGQHET